MDMSTYHVFMATPSKRSLKPVVVRPVAKLPSKAAASKPFLRFYHSEDLRRRTLAVLEAIEQAPQPARYRDDLADIAVELAHAGMDYYFINPLQRANVGFLVQTSASVGGAAVCKSSARSSATSSGGWIDTSFSRFVVQSANSCARRVAP